MKDMAIICPECNGTKLYKVYACFIIKCTKCDEKGYKLLLVDNKPQENIKEEDNNVDIKQFLFTKTLPNSINSEQQDVSRETIRKRGRPKKSNH